MRICLPACAKHLLLRVAGAEGEYGLSLPGREEVLVHAAQKGVVDAVLRRAADHRVNAASRTQRRLVGVDPGLDVRAGERTKTKETTAARAGLDLGTVTGRVLVRRKVEARLDVS